MKKAKGKNGKREDKYKKRRTKKFDYSIMHLGFSSKSKQDRRYRENQKSPVKKQKASNS